MNEPIRKDILAVFNEILKILEVKEGRDASEVKSLSNNVIHNASIFQDGDSVSVAILVYSLSKIMERMGSQLNYERLYAMISKSCQFLSRGDEDNFRLSIKNIFKFISEMDFKLKLYIEEVINQAQIKKGCKLCAHGISAGRAAEVLGISQWELLNYIGKTTITNRFAEEISVKKRLEHARRLFA